MKLLFVPLDIEVTDLSVELGELHNHNLTSWKTNHVLGKENNYQKYRNLLDQIPISNITLFVHRFQQKVVNPHCDYYPGTNHLLDEHVAENEPAGYHVVLKGKCDALEIFNGKEWINPVLPKCPVAYLLRLTSCLHRVKEDYMREILFIRGFLDVEKHNQLIQRSIKRYGDLAIYQ